MMIMLSLNLGRCGWFKPRFQILDHGWHLHDFGSPYSDIWVIVVITLVEKIAKSQWKAHRTRRISGIYRLVKGRNMMEISPSKSWKSAHRCASYAS